MPRKCHTTASEVRKQDALGEPSQPSGSLARFPKYRLHKASGQAVVTLAGRDMYLGQHGTAASKQEYRRRMAEWAAAGCPKTAHLSPASELTVADLILRYWRHVKVYYRPETRDGTIAPTLRRLRRLYGPTLAKDFGPLALKGFRQALIDEGDEKGGRLSRRYINKNVQWVRRLFRWAVGEELVAPGTLHALAAVEGLKHGRTDAPEKKPVTAVPDATIEATLPHLPQVVADMVRLQRLTGMRPGEVCAMTAAELDTTSEVWIYTPERHKTAHHGKTRTITIGPRAQVLLRGYLKTDLAAPFFSPAESEQLRKEQLRAVRKTPLTPSQRKRDAERRRRPRRQFRPAYTTTSYGVAVRRACENAGLPPWSPNRLRHAKATELRKIYGLDGAGAILGHAKLETTQIYAERSSELASKIALATG